MMDDHHNTTIFAPGHICEQVLIPNIDLEKIMVEINNISFRKFASDILGNTYETYLSTKLMLKDGVLTSEERTDIRKIGGIFYTPSIIVHYMVNNTLGKRINELEVKYGLKAIDHVKKIKVLDPACGSGSFLIYAYKVLSDFYTVTNEKLNIERLKLLESLNKTDMFKRMEVFQQLPEQLVDIPHHILEKQLYGVDIDNEAAELASVNLTMQAFSESKRERLPLILNKNIKVGNSLISGTEEELYQLFGDDWANKLPFNWQQEFPDVFANGGFDFVIGNPPYIDSESMVNNGQEDVRTAIQSTYTMVKGNWDIYIAFFELGFRLLNEEGELTFITPDKWISKPFGEELRKGLLGNMYSIVNTGREIFGQSKVDSIVSFYSKKTNTDLKVIKLEGQEFNLKKTIEKNTIKAPFALDYLFSNQTSLLNKIEAMPSKISDLGICENACATSDCYKLKPLVKNSDGNFDKETTLKVINTGTISKYSNRWGISKMKYLRDDYLYPVVNRAEFNTLFKNTYAKKSVLPKIIMKGLNLLDAYLDSDGDIIPGKSTLMIANNDVRKLKLLLAIVNCKLTIFYIKEKYSASSYNQGIGFTKGMINDFPLPKLEEDDQNSLIDLVDRILPIAASIDFSSNEDKKNRVKDLQHQIDLLIYKFYLLSPEEITLIDKT